MASNYFTISPTGGTGSTYLDITASQLNNTTNDRVAVVSITNGSVTKTVTATQFGKPSITGLSFPISAPATGASYTFTVHTHYDVQFRNKPDWVKIDDGQGNYISSATTIDKSVANGKTYNLTVDPNADNNDRSTSFGMYHYMYNNLMSDYVSMGISQPQGAEDYITIPSTIALDCDDTNAKSIPVNANVTWSASISNTSEFELAGGQGYVTVRAKANNTGSTRKTTTLSIASTKASFPYTATCVVTQFRQPTISIVDGGTVPPTGGSKTVRVVSDYYWWIQPTVMPETPTANIPYITMTGKVAGQNMSPTEGANYTLTWNSNDGNIRNDNLYVGYLKTDNSSTGRSATYANYIQDNEASETLSVSPHRIPENATSYVSSGGGTYQVVVTTGRAWQLNGTPSFCVVNPSTGTGTTTVTITVPATDLNRYRSESIYFVTNDGGAIASDSVAVYQESIYEEEPYILVDNVDTEYMEVPSGANSYSFSVSANTQWSCVMDEWIHMSPTTGGTGNTSHSFSVDANSGATRDGSIDFVPLGAGTSIAFLNIRQASGTTPVVVDSISLGTTGSSIGSGTSVLNSVYVTASTAWNITSSPSWVTWSTTGGTAGTQFINWSADANTGSSRTGTTIFVAGTASANYTVEQDAAYTPPTPTWVASPDEFEEPSQTSQTLYAYITAATSWYIQKSGDADANWVNILYPTSTQTAGTSQIVFYIAQNSSGAPRSARIDIVSATDNQVKLTVFVDQDYP